MSTTVRRGLFLHPEAAAQIRSDIGAADGNEVCFVALIADDRSTIADPRVVARGHANAVLAAIGDVPPGAIVLHNHPSGNLTPSDADLAIAAQLYSRGLGFGIVDSHAERLYVVVEPPADRSLEPIAADEIERILGADGPISRAHPAYEDRPAQRDLARAIADTYNDGGVRIAEAGTGIGKSIAYLVPAILWADRNRERTVVSTNTINLQEQLLLKDLPFLRRALGIPFRYALVKGRHNYISIRRARLAAMHAPSLFETPQRAELEALSSWLESTREGSLQDLPFQPSSDVWDEVVSDSDACLRARCPHFEACFYQRARRDAAAADVLVVNHHLLFSDLAVRRAQDNYSAGAVLPPYRRLVLDEAHNLEDAATSHLGAQVTRTSLLRPLARLDRRGRGVLASVQARLVGGAPDMLRQDALAMIAKLRETAESVRERAADLFGRLDDIVARAADGVVRLEPGWDATVDWGPGGAAVTESLIIVLGEVARETARLRERILLDRSWADNLAAETLELQAIEVRVRETAAALRTVLQPGDDAVPLVRWLQRRGGGREGGVAASAAPVDLAGALREGLFERIDTAVLTSATLATRDGFGFLRARLGLGPGMRTRESTHLSPFAYETQTIIALPTDLPIPRPNDDSFDGVVSAVTEDLARLTNGGLFVLFTSHRSLRGTAAVLRRRGVEGRWPLFVQGERPRFKLLEAFRDAGDGLLLGVASFWEGVDVPGDPLRGLILAKLPFKVPSEPLTAARIEAIERDGGNGFRDYMLPHAALRLKQGFGRLIRTATDRGAVVILDRRIHDRGYGRYLLEGLPPAPVRRAPWAALREELRTFYLGPS